MLRLSSQLPHRLLETCRCSAWYKKDRETLSRHTVLMALLPETFDNEKVPGAAGELTSRLLEERKVLSLHYPHLYDPEALGAPPALDSEDYCSLLEEIHNLELEQAGLSEEGWEESEMKRGAIESLFMPIQEVDPFYAEEALAVWNEIRHAYEIIVGENGMNVSLVGIEDRVPRRGARRSFAPEVLADRFPIYTHRPGDRAHRGSRLVHLAYVHPLHFRLQSLDPCYP